MDKEKLLSDSPGSSVECSPQARASRKSVPDFRLNMGQNSTRPCRISALDGDSPILSGHNFNLEVKLMLCKRFLSESSSNDPVEMTTFVNFFPLGAELSALLYEALKHQHGQVKVLHVSELFNDCLRGSNLVKSEILLILLGLQASTFCALDDFRNLVTVLLTIAPSFVRSRIFKSGEDVAEIGISSLSRSLVEDAYSIFGLSSGQAISRNQLMQWLQNRPQVLDLAFWPFKKLFMDGPAISLERLSSWNQRHDWSADDSADACTKARALNLDHAHCFWEPIFQDCSAKAPLFRSKHVTVQYKGKVYLFGGQGKHTTLKDTWEFDIGSNTWLQLTPDDIIASPPILQEHTAVLHQASIYVFGGAFSTDCSVPLWKFDLTCHCWKSLCTSSRDRNAVPVNRRCHTAVTYRNRMYVFGGFVDGRRSTNELWEYDFAKNSWRLILSSGSKSPSASPRSCHSAIVHCNAMWVFGGIVDLQKKNDLWRYDFDLSVWTKIKCRNPPPPVSCHSVTKVGTSMVVFGGETNAGLSNVMWRFGFDTYSWMKISPIGGIAPSVRSSHTMIVDDFDRIKSAEILEPVAPTFCPSRFIHVKSSAPTTLGLPLLLSESAAFLKSSDYGRYEETSFICNSTRESSLPPVEACEYKQFRAMPERTQKSDGVNGASEPSDLPLHDRTFSVFLFGGLGKVSGDLDKSVIEVWRCEIGRPSLPCQAVTKSVASLNEHLSKSVDNIDHCGGTTAYSMLTNDTGLTRSVRQPGTVGVVNSGFKRFPSVALNRRESKAEKDLFVEDLDEFT